VRRLLLAFSFVTLAFAPFDVSAQAGHRPERDSWFGVDKIKHFFMSAFIESMTFSGLQAAGANRNAAFAGAISATAALGVAKEMHDKKTKGVFSFRDLTWDGLGATAGLVMLKSTQR
jgi:putative lipoprotein